MNQRRLIAHLLAVLCGPLGACGADVAPPTVAPATQASTAVIIRPALCDRAGQDAVRDLFCASAPPRIGGLYDLQLALGLQTTQHADGVVYHNNPILLGLSTSLSAHLVSPINPRALLIGADVALAFQRGVQRVELAARARDRTDFNFYLLTFRQQCSDTPEGCAPSDLYTPRVEQSWLALKAQDDEDLKNTPSDCRQCHRRGRATSQLLMRELESPWTHFFDSAHNQLDVAPGVRGGDLMRDYQAAHGDESYAAIAVDDYPLIAPFALERLVEAVQPVLFDAPQIERERWPQQAGAYAEDPAPSPTWERAYAAFLRGEQLAPPYLEVRATDPDKQQQLTAAYRSALADDSVQLPDLAEIFPDDPHTRARIGLQTEPDASPIETLIQGCGSCHNDVLDQSLSRARFNIDLCRLDSGELDLAIERLERSRELPGAMPPPEARQLDPAARTRLIAYLRDEARGADPVPALAHASEAGMAIVARRER